MRPIVGDSAGRCLIESIAVVSKAIASTLGPHGRAVMMHQPPAPPTLLRDGYSIARELSDDSGPRSIGARILKDTLFDIDRDLGDGTSTAAVLVGSLVCGGYLLRRAGIDSGELTGAMLDLNAQIAADAPHFLLDSGYEDLALAVARAAARDDEIARWIASVCLRLGPDGVIQVREGQGIEDEAELISGTTADATLVSRELSQKPEAVYVNLHRPFVLVADEEIRDFGALLPVLEGFAARDKALLIVARDVTGPALQALVRNKRESGLHIAALRIADATERGFEVLQDLAIATGAELVSDRFGTCVALLRPHVLGQADEVTIEANLLTILGGKGSVEDVERRRAELRLRIARERYLSYDREQLQLRLARLSTGFARVRVAGSSQPERDLRLAAARKAVAALQAARSGVVCGGGMLHLGLAKRLAAGNDAGLPMTAARRLLAQALRQIPRCMINNAGADPAAWIGQMETLTSRRHGLNIATLALEDLVDAGVADAAPIALGTIERSLSAAAAILRIDAIIAR